MKTVNELEMKRQDFTANIHVNATANEAFEKIAKVDDWWSKNFTGRALRQGDTFTIRSGDTKVHFRVTEAIPGEIIVWRVTDCHLPWLNDKTEWTDTKVIWEIFPKINGTQIKMTHVGLMPDMECYEMCRDDWMDFIKGSLLKFINENKGVPR